MAPLRLARLPVLTAAYLLAVAVLVPAALSAQNGGITGSIINGSRVAGWGAASIDSTPLHSTEGLGLTTRLPGRDLPLLQDTVLSQRRMTVAMSGIALLTHLPIWGLVAHRDLGGDQGFTHRGRIALAAAGSGAAVAWAAQRKGARFSTALAGSALGAGAVLGWAYNTGDDGNLPFLIGVVALPVAHGALVALIARR